VNSSSSPGDAIEVDGARTHNLQGVSCRFPHRSISVVTGVSGSGKSSLAFDTVFAEGQRRYVETLSTYARQFLQQMQKPPVDAVRHVPPALALRQGNPIAGARSSVATVTELDDHLRLLWSSAGKMTCRVCGAPVHPWTVATAVRWLEENISGERIVVIGTAEPDPDESMATLLRQLAADGHRRLWVDGRFVDIDGVDVAEIVDRTEVDVVIDRLQVEPGAPRTAEAIDAAMQFGEPSARVLLWDQRDGDEVPTKTFYAGWRCGECHTAHHRPVPALFNPSSQVGSCATCEGYGRTVGIDEAKVVPDPRATLADGAVACFQSSTTRKHHRAMMQAAQDAGIAVDVAWQHLDDDARAWVFEGDPDRGYVGVHGFFEALEDKRYKPHIRILIARYRGYTHCRSCRGSGLSADALSVRVAGRTLADLHRMRIDLVAGWLQSLDLGDELQSALDALLREIGDRVRFLREVGVGYLTLDRPSRTLSGGEMHRVVLATSVGRMLTDTCYVLDEPTAGLHAADTERLFGVVRRLRDLGNTVIVVEHDPDVIRQAEWVVEMGPKGGDAGGQIVYEGELAGLLADETTATGEMMGRRGITVREAPVDGGDWLTVRHACLHNLRDVSVSFPKGHMTAVTGVSGSGKSSLVHHVLHGRLMESRGQRPSHNLGPAAVFGDDFDEVVLVDQGSIPKSSRSNALTFSGAYTPLRELFADVGLAKLRGYTPGTYSFNTKGGRCERCEGTGIITIEMHFIADVELTCDVCHGRRFRDEVLEIKVDDRSIADVFDMTIDEAVAFFADRRPIHRRLKPLQTVGLGYLRLGQTTAKMSGGELQRLKMASYVGKQRSAKGEKLFLFDEPTIGLHLRDVEQLVAAMRELTSAGHTVVVVEHNLDLVAACDWVIDLGPGAGPDGGHIVYEGPVHGLVDEDASVTGRHLQSSLADASA